MKGIVPEEVVLTEQLSLARGSFMQTYEGICSRRGGPNRGVVSGQGFIYVKILRDMFQKRSEQREGLWPGVH